MLLTDYRKPLARLIEAITVAKTVKKLKKPEAELEAKVARAFQLQKRAYLRAFERLKGEFSEALTESRLLKLFASAVLIPSEGMADAIQTAFESVLLLGATDAIAQYSLGIDFDLDNPLALALLKNYGAEQVTLINETTQQGLASLILKGAEEGASYTRMAKLISERFDGFSKARARLVATDQLARAYSFGNYAAVKSAEETGLKFEKKWLTTGDSKVTPGCKENEDQGWIAFDKDHSSGDQYPPRFPGCRCVEQYQRVKA